MSQRGVSQREAEGRCCPRAVGEPKGLAARARYPQELGEPQGSGSRAVEAGEDSARPCAALGLGEHCTGSLLMSHCRYVSVSLEALPEGPETSTAGEQSDVRAAQPLVSRVNPCPRTQWGVQLPWAT